MEDQENLVVFSQPKSGVIVINNFDKFGLVGTIIVLLIVYFNLATPKYPILSYILAFIPLFASVIVVIFSSNFAYKISFDLNKNEVCFFMFRKKGTVTLCIEDIEKVNLNVYITFYANKRIIKYNEVVNKEIVRLIETFMPVNWGILGKILHRWW
jgi:hypothetical protein